jgi:hypothetical protein
MAKRQRFYPWYAYIKDKPALRRRCPKCRYTHHGQHEVCEVCRQCMETVRCARVKSED